MSLRSIFDFKEKVHRSGRLDSCWLCKWLTKAGGKCQRLWDGFEGES